MHQETAAFCFLTEIELMNANEHLIHSNVWNEVHQSRHVVAHASPHDSLNRICKALLLWVLLIQPFAQVFVFSNLIHKTFGGEVQLSEN